MNNQEISNNLVRLRQKKGWTQDDLALKLNITRQAISKWETGVTLPNIDILLSLSKIYDISINEIIEPSNYKSITDFEEIQTIDTNKIRESLFNIEKRKIVIASMGASPDTVNYLETIFSEINFLEEREGIGRIQIEKVKKAEEEIINCINQKIALE